MKTIALMFAVVLAAVAGRAQPAFQPRPPMMPPYLPSMPPNLPSRGAPSGVSAKAPVNYCIRVEWKDVKSDPKFLEVVTTEGEFDLNTMQKDSVKIGSFDVPVTLQLRGTLHELSDDQGRLDLYLGRTIPYVTGSFGSGLSASPSYSQMNVGLTCSFIVTFGKSLVIENDDNGAVSVVVKRLAK